MLPPLANRNALTLLVANRGMGTGTDNIASSVERVSPPRAALLSPEEDVNAGEVAFVVLMGLLSVGWYVLGPVPQTSKPLRELGPPS